MSTKSKASNPGAVMPISSVILIALLSFGIGIFVGAGVDLKGHEPAPMSSGAGTGGSQPEVDSKRVLEAINTSNNLEMLVTIGNEMFDVHRADLAIPAYEKALSIKADDPNVRTDLGIMYRESGRPDEAVKQFREAMRIDPKHENSHYNLGIVLLHDKNDVQGAIEVWEKYLRLFPNGEHAKRVQENLAKLKSSQIR